MEMIEPSAPGYRSPAPAPPPPTSGDVATVVGSALRCAARVAVMILRHQLHRDPTRVGSQVRLPDGRTFRIFRETSSDAPAEGRPVTLAVRFHLRGVPSGSRLRRFLFERESILNTVLFAGFSGYLVKLWMVDPESADYAGLYLWSGTDSADRYARYITAALRPLSIAGSVGYEIIDESDLNTFIVGAKV